MNVSGYLGTSNQLWALRVVLNTVENNFDHRKYLLEFYVWWVGSWLNPFSFLHLFLKILYHVKTPAILN